MLFDVKRMQNALVEFEIDLTRMPLGKLSRKQIESAYSILTEVTEILESQRDENLKKARLLDCSNRFYTLIPQDFGLDAPPLLDNDAIIKVINISRQKMWNPDVGIHS